MYSNQIEIDTAQVRTAAAKLESIAEYTPLKNPVPTPVGRSSHTAIAAVTTFLNEWEPAIKTLREDAISTVKSIRDACTNFETIETRAQERFERSRGMK